VPLIVLWAGFETTAKVIILFMFAFFPMVINTYQGVKSVDPKLQSRSAARSVAASGTWEHRAPRCPAVHRHGVAARARARLDRPGARRPLHRDLRHRLPDRAHRGTYQVKMFVPIVTLGLLGVTLTAPLRFVEKRVAPWTAASDQD
jgi:ABC-type nitrate/sulfonate/bicarbonate transport system permease component